METGRSILQQKGYVLQKETENARISIPNNAFLATKEADTFLIRDISSRRTPGKDATVLTNEIEILSETNHPHIVSIKESFGVYVVMEHCEGGNLAERCQKGPLEEAEILSWIVEICMALQAIHEKGLLHKHLTPKNISFTHSGLVCLGNFGEIHENFRTSTSTTDSTLFGECYIPPELFTDRRYDDKGDIWSLGCILFELCTQTQAFTAENTVALMPKITGGPYPSLPEMFSPELNQLLTDIFSKDSESRPKAKEILERPFIINCISSKTKKTLEELQSMLNNLRKVADDLERVHHGTTIGSLAGGVIGAMGGITSIGLILAPFTLGASLIVTGVGVGVSVVGGATAGVSNITNMVNQTSDRKAVQSILKEFEQKINAVVTWLQQISSSLESIRDRCDDIDDSELNTQSLSRLGLRVGRGIGGVAELVRLVQVMNIGKIAAQASRAVRVAEAATGVLSGLFVAVDIFFIAMDAKELYHIRQAQAAEGPATSEIMRFVQSVREAADNLQKELDKLKQMSSSIRLDAENDGNMGGWEDMELV